MHGRIELRARRVAQRNQCVKGVLNIMGTRKKVEVFSAGCSACKETIEVVKRLAGSHEVIVHDMNKSEVASKAKEYGVRTVPAIVVDGKLLSSLRVVDLKEALEKRGLSKSGTKKDLAERLKVVSLHSLLCRCIRL